MTKSVGRSRVTRVLTTGCLAVLFVWGVATTAAAQQWVAAWGSSLQGPSPDEWAISNATIRLMARSTVAGDRVWVRLENTYGEDPLTIANATIALQTIGPSLVAESSRPLLFGDVRSVTIPAASLS